MKLVSFRGGGALKDRGFLNFFFFLKFIYFERGKQRERESRGGAEREGERESPKQAPHCQRGARCGLEPMNREIID